MEKSDLAPGLLLAAPTLRDPNFNKTVVLLGRHDDEGALGWVINGRELATAVELFKSSGLFPEATRYPDTPAFRRLASIGGPVAPETGWLIFRTEEPRITFPGQLELGRGIAVTGEASAFGEFIGAGDAVDFRLVLGCAGWAPGQLEAEIGEGAWLPAALDADLLFDFLGERCWDEAYQRAIGTAPAAFSGKPAKA
jgi:putative transcriptional regulator